MYLKSIKRQKKVYTPHGKNNTEENKRKLEIKQNLYQWKVSSLTFKTNTRLQVLTCLSILLPQRIGNYFKRHKLTKRTEKEKIYKRIKKKKKNQKANDKVATDFRALGKLKSKPTGWAGGRRGGWKELAGSQPGTWKGSGLGDRSRLGRQEWRWGGREEGQAGRRSL